MSEPIEDERVGKPDCDCGHSSMRHHGSSRDAYGFLWSNLRHEFNGCKDCSWCDYYKPRSPSVQSVVPRENEE